MKDYRKPAIAAIAKQVEGIAMELQIFSKDFGKVESPYDLAASLGGSLTDAVDDLEQLMVSQRVAKAIADFVEP